MKRKFFLAIVFLFVPFTKVLATSTIVMDGLSGRVLYAQNKNDIALIASTTKIMTAIIAIEQGNIDETVIINEDILDSYGSGIYIEVGEELTLKDLIYGLMLRSGNDAAIAIADAISGDMKSFVGLMNSYAYSIGMKNTTFINSHGLENDKGEGNTSTVYDMALLMKYAMQNETFRKITGTKKITVKSNKKTYVWFNKNKLLNDYEYLTGGKTGFTKKARRTLVTSASKDDKELIVVTFNDPDDFNNHKKLYEEYFDKYELVKVLDKNNSINDNDSLYIKKDFFMLLKKSEYDDVKVDVKIANPNQEVAGFVTVYFEDELLYDEPIFVKEESEKSKESILKKIIEFFKFW